MYERFYQLRNRPFVLSPDPEFVYPSRVHREALSYLRFAVEGHAGFVVVTGEIGSGKTTLLQVLLGTLDGQTTVVRLVNTLLTGPELLESLLLDLGIEHPPVTKPAMLRELARVLVEQRAAGRRVVAIIDEAQNLSLEALEELRMLSNLETEKSKLIQIILVGQPDLRDSLERPALEQLRQRVTVRYHIEPLDIEETARYINHRLNRAALAAPLVFAREVTDLVYARSGGVPRMINVICDAVLLFGYAEDRRVIDPSLVHEAIAELESTHILRRQAAPVTPTRPTVTAEPSVGAAAPAAAAAPPARPVAPPTQPLADLPLKSATAVPSAADVHLRPSPDLVRMREARNVQRVSVARPAAPAQTAGATPGVAPGRPPVPAFASKSARPAGGWGWVKTVLFGLGPEAEGR